MKTAKILSVLTVFLLILSLAIAALASFFPVKRIASKKPVDAIRNR